MADRTSAADSAAAQSTRATWHEAAPRWLLLLSISFAPWAFGCVHKGPIIALNVQLSLILCAWIISCIRQRAWPQIPNVLAGVVAGLLLLGWWAVLNARFEYNPETVSFQSLDPLLSSGPGSIHRAFSLASVLNWTLLLGVTCFVCDLANNPKWRKRLLQVMAANGAILAGLGLVQRFSGANGIFWAGPSSPAFFSTFLNHDNAAAFLNLTWPLLGIGFVLALKRGNAGLQRLAWGSGLFLSLAGVMVSGSRTGSLLACSLFSAGFGWFAWRIIRRDVCGHQRLQALIASVLLLLLFAAVISLAGFETTLARWARLESELTASNYRWLAYQVCLDMISDSSWWGFGPGTFQTAFPYFTPSVGDALKGRWIHAHQDYMQTLVEWGYTGSSLFAAYIFVGLLRSSRIARDYRDVRDQTRHFGIVLALLGVLLHAIVDFPLQILSIQLYFVVLLGIIWANPALDEQR